MILGILATFLVGYLGIKYTYKHKTITNLLFFENGCVSLFNSVMKDVEDVEIKYKGKKIDENLLLYKGTFFNSGNTDIDKTAIHKPIRLTLPDNFEWKKIKIIEQSHEININLNYDESEAIFEWDILKENEYFTFDSLIEYKPAQVQPSDQPVTDITNYLTKSIKIAHRITNLKSVERGDMPSKPVSWSNFIFLCLAVCLIFAFSFFKSAGQYIFPEYDISYEVETDTTRIYSSIKSFDDKNIEFVDENNNIVLKEISKSNDIGLTGKVKTTKKDPSILSLIAGGFIALLMLVVFITFLYLQNKDIVMYKKVKQLADKYHNLN